MRGNNLVGSVELGRRCAKDALRGVLGLCCQRMPAQEARWIGRCLSCSLGRYRGHMREVYIVAHSTLLYLRPS